MEGLEARESWTPVVFSCLSLLLSTTVLNEIYICFQCSSSLFLKTDKEDTSPKSNGKLFQELIEEVMFIKCILKNR